MFHDFPSIAYTILGSLGASSVMLRRASCCYDNVFRGRRENVIVVQNSHANRRTFVGRVIVVTCKPANALPMTVQSSARSPSDRYSLTKPPHDWVLSHHSQLARVASVPNISTLNSRASRRPLHMKLTTSSLLQLLRVCSHYSRPHALPAIPSERRMLADSSTATPRT